MLMPWTRELVDALELDLDPEDALVRDVLELARDAAHAVERPAAPVTTFLVGYAAARRGGGTQALSECADIARELLARRASTDPRPDRPA